MDRDVREDHAGQINPAVRARAASARSDGISAPLSGPPDALRWRCVTLLEMLTDTRYSGGAAGMPSDDDLARRFAAGDPSVLDELYAALRRVDADRRAPPGRRRPFARRRGRAHGDAQGLAGRRHASSPTGRSHRGCSRSCAAARSTSARRERRHRTQSLDAPGPEPAATPTGDVESAWEAWTVREAFRTLPHDEHSVMRLAYYEQYTHSEIAARPRDPDRNGEVALGPCPRTPPLAARTAVRCSPADAL